MGRQINYLVLVILSVAVCAQSRCTSTQTQTTYWGHQNIVHVESKPLKKLQGGIILGFPTAAPIPKDRVLVEVFDRPELAEDGNPNRGGQKRLMACLTAKDGRFSFDLPPGKYELRCSKASEWNCTSTIVEVSKSGSSKGLSVRLELAE